MTHVNFWWYKRAMCLECTAHYKNSYPEVWMSADQPGIKEEILPMFITTIAVKVIVHNNMFQHCMVTNRTVYREATMKIDKVLYENDDEHCM